MRVVGNMHAGEGGVHACGQSGLEDNRPGCDAIEEADGAEAWWSVIGQAMSADDRTDSEWWQEVTELMNHEGIEDAVATGVNHMQLEQGASSDAWCDDEWPF